MQAFKNSKREAGDRFNAGDIAAVEIFPVFLLPDIAPQNTEDHDGHDHEIQLEDLAAVDDEEAKACLGGEKLADDDADEAETDVDLHVGENQRD